MKSQVHTKIHKSVWKISALLMFLFQCLFSYKVEYMNILTFNPCLMFGSLCCTVNPNNNNYLFRQ